MIIVMKGFLYGQTEYNMLNNSIHLSDYINQAKSFSFDFLSITDPNLYGNYKFYTQCQKQNIKPIIGLEYAYRTEDQNISHALLYAKNNNGYRNLLKISTRVKLEQLDDLDEIMQYDDLAIIFVFNNSFLERLLYSKEFKILDEFCQKIKMFKDYYIGVSYTNNLQKINLNKEMDEYAQKHSIRCLPIHQCKYLTNQDVIIYEALTAIAGHPIKISDYEDYSFEINPLEDERINEFVNSINLNLFNDKIELPTYPNTKGVTSKNYLQALCYKGLEKRGCLLANYQNRLKYELEVIDKMGYNDYFLIVWDFVKYAKQHNILVGPGRGSAAGSLVSFVLGITEVDPIKYNLLFERFLNPQRISMPDIDVDFPDVYRDQVISHVQSLYGDKHVCNISAYGTFLVKSATRDLSKVFKIDSLRVEKIISMIEEYGFEKMLKEYENDKLYDFFFVAKGLVGLPRHISTHAAGIILSKEPLDDIIALQPGINGLLQSQLEASDLEKIGLLKMDFLGIRNLTMIEDMMSEIPNFNFQSLRNIPLDDFKVYNMLQHADTLGIFQLESQGIRNVLLKLKPTVFEDLVAVLALYRPGPMDNIDEFIRRKHNGKFSYIHPSLKPILESTYGIIIYQEQIMMIAQVFAGYSLAEADLLRRAISKKSIDILQSLKEDFINKAVKKGYSNDVASEVYELIFKFANYGFNRSHSVSYAMLSYQMAYFKANFFNVFMANVLNNTIGNSKTLISYIKYAKERGVITYKPNVNISGLKFCITKLGLFMPLNTIFSIGDSLAKSIVSERTANGQFKNFNDFKHRCQFLSSQSLQALIFAGALDIFGITKKTMMNNSSVEDEIFFKHMQGVIASTDEYEFNYLKEMELKYLGLNLEYNIFNDINVLQRKYKATFLNDSTYKAQGRYLVSFTDFKEIKTKKGDLMLIGSIEDSITSKRFVIFPSIYKTLDVTVAKDKIYLILAILDKDNKNEDSFNIQKIALIK